MEKNTKTQTKKNLKPLTLLSAIERVANLSKDSKLTAAFFTKAHREISFLAQKYGITELQAVFFSVCMERGPRRIDFEDIAIHLDIAKLKMLQYGSDIDALVRRRLLKYRNRDEEEDFDVPVAVMKSLKHNVVYELPKRTDLDCPAFFEFMNNYYDDLNDDAISPSDLAEELKELLNDNPQLHFCKRINELSLSATDLLLLLTFCNLFVNHEDDDVRLCQLREVFATSRAFLNVRNELMNGEHELMKRKLIEFKCEDGMANNNAFKLTEEAKADLLAELNIKSHDPKIANVIKPAELTPKTMFYSAEVGGKVDELASFFDSEKYAEIRKRMKEQGFRSGFACLFYGGPGTGKTETVYQLARNTGRSIMMVDVPQIKSMWVGGSEKNIKAVFDRYRELVKRSKIMPILLFNEADAIIGVRMNGAERAVDKMENSIQNIILQEMEDLDGILIATTNLVENLDAAFERRFLYKIKFEQPDEKVRSQIWKQMIPALTPDDCHTLGKRYNFSGGQIENVARKYSINLILRGESDNYLDVLNDYCASETLASTQNRRLGFR